MRTCLGLLSLSCILFALAVAVGDGALVLGVALDETSATAAFFKDDKPVFTSSIALDEDYQDYVYNTLKTQGQLVVEQDKLYRILRNGTRTLVANDGHNSQLATKALSGALERILQQARAELGSHLRLGAVVFPTHFNASSENSLLAAARVVEPKFNNTLRLMRSHKAALLTYPENGCFESWGNFEAHRRGHDHAILLQHSSGAIDLTFAKIVHWGGGILDSNVRTAKVFSLKEAVEAILKEEEWHDSKAVIVAGDFGEQEVRSLSRYLGDMVPSLTDKVKSSKAGPRFVTAQGAACLARWHVNNPDDRTRVGPTEGHEEL